MSTSKKAVNATTKGNLLDAYEEVLAERRAEFEQELRDKTAEYNQAQARIREQDAYDFHIMKRNREDALAQELHSRGMAVSQREAAVEVAEQTLSANEAHYNELKSEVAEFAKTLQKATEEGFTKGQQEARTAAYNDGRIKDAEHKAATEVLTNRISLLEEAIHDKDELIATLRQELSSANDRVSSVAKDAFAAAGQSKVSIQNTPSK